MSDGFRPVLLVALVAVGGGLGSLARSGVSLLLPPVTAAGFAWPTLTVNMAGCFLLGIASPLLLAVGPRAQYLRLLLVTGVLSSLTTFSGFAWQERVLVAAAAWPVAVLYLAATVFGGLAATCAGVRAVRVFTWLPRPEGP